MAGIAATFGKLSETSHILDAGGPLDATDIMPAGSVSNTEWVTGGGVVVVNQTECKRAG